MKSSISFCIHLYHRSMSKLCNRPQIQPSPHQTSTFLIVI